MRDLGWPQDRRSALDPNRLRPVSDRTDAASDPATSCPTCGSKNLAAAGKSPTESTYRRCITCGDVWNPGRPLMAPRRGPRW
jgi:hypothetical protein